MAFLQLLEQLSVPNYDNGVCFTNPERIHRIDSLLWNSRYRRINPDGLFCMYAVKPLQDIRNPILISTHVDCVMRHLFSREHGADQLLGTYDNCLTNCAVLSLMLDGALPDNVLVAFTGDEEDSSRGAAQLVRYLTEQQKTPAVTVVLDVTDMAWESDFTVENNFWSDDLGQKVIHGAEATGGCWKFVPSQVDDIPQYVPAARVIREEATADESWEYDEHDWPCFSLCIPVYGPMHSSAGVLVRKTAAVAYIHALRQLAAILAGAV